MKKEKNTFTKRYVQLLKKDGMLPTFLGEIRKIIKDFFKDLLQDVFKVELDAYLGYGKHQKNDSTNSWNGYSPKTAKGILGTMNLKLPWDRDASFKPIILPKHKKDIIELESKVISLYAMGTSTRDVIAIIKKLHGFDMDPSYIGKSTEQLWPKIEEFKTRKLDKIYPMILLDGIRFKTREDGISKEVSI